VNFLLSSPCPKVYASNRVRAFCDCASCDCVCEVNQQNRQQLGQFQPNRSINPTDPTNTDPIAMGILFPNEPLFRNADYYTAPKFDPSEVKVMYVLHGLAANA